MFKEYLNLKTKAAVHKRTLSCRLLRLLIKKDWFSSSFISSLYEGGAGTRRKITFCATKLPSTARHNFFNIWFVLIFSSLQLLYFGFTHFTSQLCRGYTILYAESVHFVSKRTFSNCIFFCSFHYPGSWMITAVQNRIKLATNLNFTQHIRTF